MLKRDVLTPKYIAIVVFVFITLVLLTAFTLFKPILWTTENPNINLAGIGTKDNPTTDPEKLTPIIEQIDQIQIKYGPGWIHWVMSAYQKPKDSSDPLFPIDGHYTIESWYFVNSAGVAEKSLISTSDTDGKILQQIGCGDGVCGNVSLIGLAEFDDIRLVNSFNPVPFKHNSASALLREINMADTEVMGWVESDENGLILYISTFHSNLNNQTIQSLSPAFEGTEVVLGVYVISGELVYYKVSSKIDGKLILESEFETTSLELVKENSLVDNQILKITNTLIERDKEK